MALTFEKVLQFIPNFNGDHPEHLNRFLMNMQTILTQFYDANDPNIFNNLMLTIALRSKITGKALECIDNCNANDWEDIKSVLTRYFGDPCNKRDLFHDLVVLKQKPTQSYTEYFDSVYKALNMLILHTKIIENDQNRIQIISAIYTDAAIGTLVKYIQEPMATFIRTKDPQTLDNIKHLIKSESKIIGNYH